MQPSLATNIRRRKPNLSLRSAIVALSVGVLLPVLLSTSVGIVTLVLGESTQSIIIGVLVVSFTAAALGGVAVVTVLLGRRARIARLQADLLTNVSHDLRTPLTSIRMYAQTLLMGRLNDHPERAEESLRTIVRETEWLEAMIDRVLVWRSAAKDREALHFVVEPVGESVRRAVERFCNMTTPDEVELQVDLDSAAPVLHDRDAIGSIVLNLLVNAYKYNRSPRNIRLKVRDEAERVTISVEDNGIGIVKHEQGRIFDPFYRIDSTREGLAAGAGLGLAIVLHLAQAHSGTVTVVSDEERGSRFTVSLPAARREQGGKL